MWATKQLKGIVEDAGLGVRAALIRRVKPPPLESLSKEAQRLVKRIKNGEAGDIDVSSRKVAEEVLSQFPGLVNTDGWPATQIKQLLGGKSNIMHWDETFAPGGKILIGHPPGPRHSYVPHLQLHRDGKIVRLLFARPRQ